MHVREDPAARPAGARSTRATAATLRWLPGAACSGARRGSTRRGRRSPAATSAGKSLTSQEYARSPTRKPSESMSPWIWRNGRMSTGPPAPSIGNGAAGRDRVMPEDRRIDAARRRAEAIGEAFDRGAPWSRHRHRRRPAAACSARRRADRRCRGYGRHGHACRARASMWSTSAARSCARISGPVSTRMRVGRSPLAEALDQQRAARAAVLGLVRIAGAPVVADPRHAGRRAAAEDGRAQPRHALTARGTLVNSR